MGSSADADQEKAYRVVATHRVKPTIFGGLCRREQRSFGAAVSFPGVHFVSFWVRIGSSDDRAPNSAVGCKEDVIRQKRRRSERCFDGISDRDTTRWHDGGFFFELRGQGRQATQHDLPFQRGCGAVEFQANLLFPIS